ncbi:MAG: hypothetical protein ACK4ND_14170 [Cytophagaceae bacterium]
MAFRSENFYIIIFFLCVFLLGCNSLKNRKVSGASDLTIKYDSINVNFPDIFLSLKDTSYTPSDTFYLVKHYVISTYETYKTFKYLNEDSVGHIYIEYKDSLMTVTDSIVTSIDTLRPFDERMLMKVENYIERDNLISKLLKNVFHFEDRSVPHEEVSEQSDKHFEDYNEKIIRSISVKILDPFGPSVNEPDNGPKNFLENAGNVFHVKSRRWLVKNTLIIKEGDEINSFVIAENERLLRQNNYTFDSKIQILDYDENKDSVDVLVIVQDVWSKSAGASFDPPTQSINLSAGDANFLGTGTSLSNSARLSEMLPAKYNYLGNFTVHNIYKTFFTGRIHYHFQDGVKSYGVSVNREFISPAIKWAGGINTGWTEIGHYPLLHAPGHPLVYFNQQDAWVGYSNNLFDDSKDQMQGNRFVIASRYQRTHYTKSAPDFFNRDMILGSVGYINTRYYKDRYIFRFGRTEDIAEGDLISLVYGVEESLSRRRPYMGVNTAWSRYSNSLGYLYASVGLGGFLYDRDWQESVLAGRLLYFTPLVKLNRWKSRYYLGMRYSELIHPMPGAVMFINDAQGLRGFNPPWLFGKRRAVLNFETNVFPPIKFFGFQTALVYFTDLAWLASDGRLFDRRSFHSAFGVGLRFRNDHMIFETIQFLFGYYPGARNLGMQEFMLFERSRFYYEFNHFQFPKPSTVGF